MDDRLDNAIAIVGMACHFPQAKNLREYWERLRDAQECVTRFDAAELRGAGVPDRLLEDPQYVPAAPILDDMEWFDAGFFAMSPRDAAIMDPQHRHFLECCWEAFEDAGHIPGRFQGSIGVFAGSGTNAYFWKNVMTNPDLVAEVGFFLLRHTRQRQGLPVHAGVIRLRPSRPVRQCADGLFHLTGGHTITPSAASWPGSATWPWPGG